MAAIVTQLRNDCDSHCMSLSPYSPGLHSVQPKPPELFFDCCCKTMFFYHSTASLSFCQMKLPLRFEERHRMTASHGNRKSERISRLARFSLGSLSVTFALSPKSVRLFELCPSTNRGRPAMIVLVIAFAHSAGKCRSSSKISTE